MVSVQPHTDVYLIQKGPELDELGRVLRGEKIIAVDTESNSLYAYREQVCLIQFSTPQADYLVDPLAMENLSSLKPVFEDPGIEKVFHAAEYDLICLHRDFNFQCAHIFDTMLAARILGRQEVGLGAILENEFGVHLDKRQQRANWGERPLSERLIDYARLDTHYLIGLRDRLESELHERQLLQLALEDFERACAPRIPENGRGGTGQRPLDCWRVSGAHDLESQKAAVLQELCRYRDQVARAMNRPLFKVINDRTLLAIAAETPDNLADLATLPGMSPGQIHRHGAALLRAVQRGLISEPIYPPKSKRPDDRYLHRLEALRAWRKYVSQQMGAPSDVILPRELMAAIAEGGPKTIADLRLLLQDSPWRLEHFGEQMLEFMRTYRR